MWWWEMSVRMLCCLWAALRWFLYTWRRASHSGCFLVPSQGLLCGKGGDMEWLVHASCLLAWTTMNYPPPLGLAEPHGAPSAGDPDAPPNELKGSFLFVDAW